MYLVWQTIRFIFVDLIWQTLYFPIWWYTQGAYHILKLIFKEIKEFAYSLNLGILFRNLFTPMYGFRDLGSRVISFFVRIVYFFILLVITVIWLVLLIVIFFVWLILPAFVLYNLLYQLKLVDFDLYQFIF